MVDRPGNGTGAVLVHNPADPCRPVVRRLGDGGKPGSARADAGPPEDIDLGEHPDLSVVVIEGVDAEPFLFSTEEGISPVETANRVLTLADAQTAAPVA